MPFYWTFLTSLGYTACMPLFSRISSELVALLCMFSIKLMSALRKGDHRKGLLDFYKLNYSCVCLKIQTFLELTACCVWGYMLISHVDWLIQLVDLL